MGSFPNPFFLLKTTTSVPITFETEEDEPLIVSLGIFAAILFGSLGVIFLIIGGCIVGHKVYMRFFKKPW